jgi:casein kinase I family protein HRR25
MLNVGNYILVREITQTDFSAIYEAVHVLKDVKVILKKSKDARTNKLLQNELKLYTYLRDTVPLPRLKASGLIEDKMYLVFEKMDRTLDQWTGEVETKELFSILYNLHENGIVHRDLKPDNFIFGYNGKCYLLDLGLAAVQSNRKIKGFVGNRRYASYTCFEPEYEYRFADDLLSLIYILLERKYGFLPWDKVMGPRKDCVLSTFYPDDVLCQIEIICRGERTFNGLYHDVFQVLD